MTQLSLLTDDAAEQPRSDTPSLWALLPAQAPEPLFIEDESLPLTASALKLYLECPRKFFYQHLLGLPGEESEAANLGSIIHSLMEVFNRRFGERPYTPETLRELAHRFFDVETPVEDLKQLGFPSREIRRVQALDPLARHDLQKRLLASIEDLAQKGYFNQPLQSLQVEEAFEFTVTALPGCQVKARIDALLEHPDGTWDIVDYKFYGPDRFSLRDPAKLAERLLSACEPLPNGDLPHRERFKTSDAKPRDYQLPLYYMATQQDARFQGKIRQLALQIIRPPLPENPKQGAIRVAIDAVELEERIPQLLQDLQQYIVEPIRQGEALAICPGRHCLQCGYLSLCEAKGQLELLEDASLEGSKA